MVSVPLFDDSFQEANSDRMKRRQRVASTMRRRSSHLLYTTVQYSTDPKAPTLAQLQEAAMPLLLRVFRQLQEGN